jgi:hypothetical protein
MSVSFSGEAAVKLGPMSSGNGKGIYGKEKDLAAPLSDMMVNGDVRFLSPSPANLLVFKENNTIHNVP